MRLKKSISILMFAVLVFVSSCKNEITEEKAQATYIKTETVQFNHDGAKLVFNGKIKEKSLTTLSSRVGGPLVEFNVEVGDYVQKGQVVASIDKRDYLLQLQSTKAQYKQLSGEYERYKELYKDNKLPANTFEKIESGYLMAKTAYENASNQLEDTDIKAPYSGYIHEKKTENHQTIGPGGAIVSIIDLSSLEVVISIPENQIASIKKSMQSYIEIKNADVSNLPAKIISIDEKAKKDGMYEVKLSFTNNNKQVYPGMSAEVTMLGNSNNKGITIPSSAIFSDGQTNCVWLYNTESKTVIKQEVVLKNFSSRGKIEVLNGLNIGDTIVTAGVHHISEGQKLEPIETPSTTNIGGLL